MPRPAPSPFLSSPASEPRADAQLRRWGPLAVAALALLLYLNILPNTFILDDRALILENSWLRSSDGWKKILTSNVLGFQGQASISNYYRPLMHLSFWAGYRVFGERPAGYHVLSVLMHALVSLLVYALVTRLSEDRRTGLVAGLLFAAHPVHTENVCWIAGYPDVQTTLFTLLAWWLYLLSASQEGKPWRRCTAAGVAICFLLALLAKETAVVLPAILLAYELLLRRAGPRQLLGRRWPEWLGLALAFAAYLLLRHRALGGLMPHTQWSGMTRSEAGWTAAALLFHYWAKIVWPAELNIFPYIPPSRSPLEWPVIAGLAAAILVAALAYWLWRQRRPELLGLVVFLVALAPSFALPYADIGLLLGERYLYLSSVGFCWLAAWLWTGAAGRWGWKPAVSALVVVLTACAARAALRNLDWRTEISFFEKTVRMSPQSALAHYHLSEACLRHNRLPEALLAAERASALRPRYAGAHHMLGQTYSAMRRPEEAIQEYQRAARYSLESGNFYDAARSLGNMSIEHAARGELEEAMRACRQALTLDSEFAAGRNNLGYLLLLAGQWDEAERELRVALRQNPTLAEAHSNLGLLYARRGELDRAAGELAEAVRLGAGNAETYARLGVVALLREDRARADEFFRQALRLDPENQRARAGLVRLRSPQ